MNKGFITPLIAVILVIAALICGYIIWSQHKTIEKLNSDFKTVSEGNSIDLQEKCAKQAEKALNIFARDNTADYTGLRYGSFAQENHYNQKMNKCFVLISYSPIYPPNYTFDTSKPLTQPTNYEDLVDAYENTDLAHCTIFGNDITTKDAKINQVCWTTDGGKNYQDYKKFVLPRMEMPDPDR